MSELGIPEGLRRALAAIAVGQEVTPPEMSLEQSRALAAAYDLPRREIECAALRCGLTPSRYVRNLGTVGIAGQLALLRATVAVVGCGGLGGWIAEALTRMGVGRLLLIDGDCFEENNLNRQLACTEATLGRPKAVCLAERLAVVNGAVETVVHQVWLDAENAAALLRGANVVADALDSLPARYDLRDATSALGMPLVHGAIAGFTGQVMTLPADLDGLRAWYGPEPPREHGIEATLGNPAPTPLLIAAWQAAQVIMLLTGIGEPLVMRMLFCDMERGDARVFDLS